MAKGFGREFDGLFFDGASRRARDAEAKKRFDHQYRFDFGNDFSANGPFYAGYVASKAGLIGLTRELAASWGRKGIRVNAIAPGFFHSRLADAVIDIYERSIQENNAIPRIGEEGELKGVAVFLAVDASSYITGQTIVVDGGMTI